jgi:plasmid stability protein
MANISVRKIDNDVLKQLRLRAVEHGCSMEEEVRQIIKAAVSPPDQLGDFVTALFASTYDGEAFVLPEREHSEPIDLA